MADEWTAACMEPDEWATWVERNPKLDLRNHAPRPCVDCPLGFAAEMRTIGRCNGTPGANEEDDVVTEPMAMVTNETRVALVAPCPTCSHEAVCGLKAALERNREVDVVLSRLPDGLSIRLAAEVDCAFYEKRRGAAKAGPGRGQFRAKVGPIGGGPGSREAEVFAALTDTGSVTAAAIRLGISDSRVRQYVDAARKRGALPAEVDALIRRRAEAVAS